MVGVVRDGQAVVSGVSPVRLEGSFDFVSGSEALSGQAIGMFRVAEGLSLIAPADLASMWWRWLASRLR